MGERYICLEAVRNNPMTILLVKNKTAKLCREALRQNTYLYLSQDSRDMLEDIIKKEE